MRSINEPANRPPLSGASKIKQMFFNSVHTF